MSTNDDFLAMLQHPGVPSHEIKPKKGCVCLLMRNLSVKNGLVKNCRVLIKDLRTHYVSVSVLDDSGHEQTGEPFLIPRINFEFEPPFTNYTVMRKQLPLRLAYATTFHSCQGLTLDRVALDFRMNIFAHGQLYTALSRVRTSTDARILLTDHTNTTVDNVVYHQLLL
jgi:hypothetical protein